MKTSCCHSKKFHKENNHVVCMNSCCNNYMNQSLTYKTRKWNNIFLLFFFIFFFILTFNDFSFNSAGIKYYNLHTHSGYDQLPLTVENLQKELEKNHILCQDQVLAQIMIESGNLQSFLTHRTNNLIGMRFPYKRKTTAIGIYLPSSNSIYRGSQQELKKHKLKNNYAVYNNWQDCIRDYKLWQEKNFKLTDSYLAFLGNCYAEDTLYVEKIKRFTNKLKAEK
jgi:hypothetical protein